MFMSKSNQRLIQQIRDLEGKVFPLAKNHALEDDDAEQGYWHDMGISLQAQSNPQFDSWCTAVSNL